MDVKTGLEAVSTECCFHLPREVVPVCHNSLRRRMIFFFILVKALKIFLLLPCVSRVCCHCGVGVLDLVNAMDVFTSITEITSFSLV